MGRSSNCGEGFQLETESSQVGRGNKKLERENLEAAQAQKSSHVATQSPPRRAPVFTEEESVIQIERREAWHLINGVTKRIEKSEVHIEQMEIRFIRRTKEIPPENNP